MDFMHWLTANGGFVHPSIEVVSDNGYSVRVRKDKCIEAGANVVCCPHKCTLSYADSRKYGLTLGAPQVPFPSLPQSVAVRLFLIKQYLLKQRSFWFPYVNILPQPDNAQSLNTALWFDEEDMLWLRGTNLGAAAVARKALWREEFDHAIGSLYPNPCDERDVWTWCVMYSVDGKLVLKYEGISTCGLQPF